MPLSEVAPLTYRTVHRSRGLAEPVTKTDMELLMKAFQPRERSLTSSRMRKAAMLRKSPWTPLFEYS